MYQLRPKSLVVLLAMIATSSFAAREDLDRDYQDEDRLTGDCFALAPACPTDGYKFVESGLILLTVPDGPAVATTPALSFPPDPGAVIGDVIVGLSINAGSGVGDFIVKLFYDVDCGGPGPVFGPVALLCRPGVADCPATGCPECGCQSPPPSEVYFSDGGVTPLGKPCPSPLPPAVCYRPAIESPPLALFRGLPKTGCWFLTLSDAPGGDTDRLRCWRVYLRNELPTAAGSSTWGTIKDQYRE